jgi:AraC-like DNA-binding protein
VTHFSGLVRAGTLAGYAEFAASLNLDAKALLRGVGLHKFDLSNVDAQIPASAVTELLERSAALSGLEDFGLRLATIRNLAHIGPVGLLVREEPTVGRAIRVAETYLRRYSDTIDFRLHEHADLALLRVQYLNASRGHTRQGTELLIGTVHRVISALAGNAWAAESISFAHPAPASRTIHLSFFRTQILFNNSFNGFILHASDLNAPLHTAGMAMPHYMKQFVEEVVATPAITFDATVRQLVFSLLPTGRCSSAAIAIHLGIDRKTLTRRLAARGTTYSEILNEVRVELARRHIRTNRSSLTETAQRLGFAGLPTFSRWFTAEFGMCATQWRTVDVNVSHKAKPRRMSAAASLTRNAIK